MVAVRGKVLRGPHQLGIRVHREVAKRPIPSCKHLLGLLLQDSGEERADQGWHVREMGVLLKA